MFEMMLNLMRENIIATLSVVEFNMAPADPNAPMSLGGAEQIMQTTRQDPALMGLNVGGKVERMPEQKREPQRNKATESNNPNTWSKTARNALCPCGSGKKYKQCHGAVTHKA